MIPPRGKEPARFREPERRATRRTVMRILLLASLLPSMAWTMTARADLDVMVPSVGSASLLSGDWTLDLQHATVMVQDDRDGGAQWKPLEWFPSADGPDDGPTVTFDDVTQRVWWRGRLGLVGAARTIGTGSVGDMTWHVALAARLPLGNGPDLTVSTGPLVVPRAEDGWQSRCLLVMPLHAHVDASIGAWWTVGPDGGDAAPGGTAWLGIDLRF